MIDPGVTHLVPAWAAECQLLSPLLQSLQTTRNHRTTGRVKARPVKANIEQKITAPVPRLTDGSRVSGPASGPSGVRGSSWTMFSPSQHHQWLVETASGIESPQQQAGHSRVGFTRLHWSQWAVVDSVVWHHGTSGHRTRHMGLPSPRRCL